MQYCITCKESPRSMTGAGFLGLAEDTTKHNCISVGMRCCIGTSHAERHHGLRTLRHATMTWW